MITRFRVQNYKALRDVELALTPIHVLIGPNDSGKTSLLEAMAALCNSVDRPLNEAFDTDWEGCELVWQKDATSIVELSCELSERGRKLRFKIGLSFGDRQRRVFLRSEELFVVGESIARVAHTHPVSNAKQILHLRDLSKVQPDGSEDVILAREVTDLLKGVQRFRWDPRMLAMPAAPDSKRRYRLEPNGFGLARCLDELLGTDRATFTTLENRFREIFPDVKSIRLASKSAYRWKEEKGRPQLPFESADGKGIEFEIEGASTVTAAQSSDGLLIVLAYLYVLYSPDPPRLLLIEEPENGLHHSKLKSVTEIVREIVKSQSRTQVVLTTHSPYLLDCFEPQEVTLCRRQNDGSVAVKTLSASDRVLSASNIFSLGEIWTSEGDDALAEPTKTESGTAS